MSHQILLDTGPIVALLDKTDSSHEKAIHLFSKITDTMITCEAVITEASFLLSKSRAQGAEAVLKFAERNSLNLTFSLSKELACIEKLLINYKTVPISLAGACLIRCAEIHHEPRIATFDKDFQIYRWGKNKRFDILS